MLWDINILHGFEIYEENELKILLIFLHLKWLICSQQVSVVVSETVLNFSNYLVSLYKIPSMQEFFFLISWQVYYMLLYEKDT